MELTSPNGDLFDLRLIGYKLPRGSDNLHDSNWLRVHTRCSVGGRAWQAIDACLLTWEVAALADWADSLAAGTPSEPELNFVEPNLWFEFLCCLEESVRFRVYFEAEHRPPWAPWEGTMRELWATLDSTPAQMREWAADLRAQLERYPVRRLAY